MHSELPTDVVAGIWQALTKFNLDHAPPDDHQHLYAVLRSPAGELQGGLLGGTYWGWLHIDALWIGDALRGQGHGSHLLAAAEDEARRRGCHSAHLDTMSFQAEGFYLRHGYSEFGRLNDIPLGHSRISMRKALT